MEAEIRKKWLISFKLNSLLSVSLFFLSFINQFSSSIFFKEFGILVGIFWGISISITYYCAYKKRGTNWLTFVIILIYLGFLESYLAPGILITLGRLSNTGINVGDVFFFAFCFVIRAYYLFNCHKLLKINRKKENVESASIYKKYSEFMTKIEHSQNLDDLNKLFIHALDNWPQWEKQTSKIYNKKKELLLKD